MSVFLSVSASLCVCVALFTDSKLEVSAGCTVHR